MALARVLELIAFLIYVQESRGHFNSLINNSPTLGQNNLNQGFQNTASFKSVTDNLFEKENLGKNTNFNSQKQVNLQQSSIPQSSPTALPQFPLQQSQNFPQLIDQQSSQQPSDLQQPLLYQPQASFVQQSIVQQQPYNYLESSAFIPVNNAGNINYQQQTGTPSIQQQLPVQVSQSVPLSNSYVPSYSSIAPVGQRMEFVTSLGGNYLVPVSTLPFSAPEGQIVTSYPTLPYTMVLSAPNPTASGNNVAMPYQHQFLNVFDNLFDNFSETTSSNEVSSLTADKIGTLLMSLLQSPRKSSKYLQPYTPHNLNQDTKSSSLKTLLPIILNLLKDKREGCGCHTCCKCKRRNRNKKDSASQSIEGYSLKRDNSLREEMFRTDEIKKDIPRMTREHNKHIKLKNPVPDISIESSEDDDMDYDQSSEEEDK